MWRPLVLLALSVTLVRAELAMRQDTELSEFDMDCIEDSAHNYIRRIEDFDDPCWSSGEGSVS